MNEESSRSSALEKIFFRTRSYQLSLKSFGHFINPSRIAANRTPPFAS